MSGDAATVDWVQFLDDHPAPIFVTGTQRSGTTLMCRMLAAHPELYLKNELIDSAKHIATETAASVVKDLSDAIEATSIGRSLPEHLQATGKSRWGLKDPSLTRALFKLPELFPGSKTIVMVRDGRAVALSYLKQRWGSAGNLYGGARRWVEEVQRQEAFVALRRDSAIFWRYEDLLADPERSLEAICAFLGVTFDPMMLRYHELDTEIRRHAGNDNAFRPVDPRLGERWRTEMSVREVRLFEGIAGEVLERHGYELTGRPTPPSLLRAALLSLHNKLVTEFHQQVRWRLRKS